MGFFSFFFLWFFLQWILSSTGTWSRVISFFYWNGEGCWLTGEFGWLAGLGLIIWGFFREGCGVYFGGFSFLLQLNIKLCLGLFSFNHRRSCITAHNSRFDWLIVYLFHVTFPSSILRRQRYRWKGRKI